MTKPTPRRNAVAGVATTLVTFAAGMALAVFVGGSASAASSRTTKKATTKATATKNGKAKTPTVRTTTADSPAAHFFVLNGTVNAASDHEIVGSSAFPNFTTGAVDNYYAFAHAHVDNSPFAEGTASPADTGPLGQTAAAGNFQQPQYADARWPGDSGKATYGSQGGPYATAEAGEYQAQAEASEASNRLSGPGPSGSQILPVPEGFDGRLGQVLAEWKAHWQDRLDPNKPAPTVTVPKAGVTVPKAGVPKPGVTVPKPGVTTPTATVTTPVTTVSTLPAAVGGVDPTPPLTVTTPTLPSPSATGGSRSLASTSTSNDGAWLLTSSTRAALDPKADKLVTSGESSLGRVSLGNGQIVIEHIHVTASIENDGTPTYKAGVSVGSASIGGVPVTIDEDGVHVAGQGNGLPYQQASDALNGALKQAGIRLFLVAPEVTKNSCDQTGTGTGTGTGTETGTTTTTTTSDQPGATSSCDQTGGTPTCNQPGGGSGPSFPGTTTTTTPSSCDQSGASTTCDQGTSTNGGTGGVPSFGTTTTTTTRTTTTTTSTDRSTTTMTPSWCDQSGTTGTIGTTGPCGRPGPAATNAATNTTATGTNTSETRTNTTTTGSGNQLGLDAGATNSGGETVRATGLHVVFTQPVSPPGVPAQYVEHILGEVYVDSLAVPATPLPKVDFSSSSSSSSSCASGGHSGQTMSGSASNAGGSSSAGGSTSSGGLSSSASGSQPTSSSTGNSLPGAFAAALRKPLWLLLAYVLWQTIVIATGWSLWNWRRGVEAS